MSDDKDDGGAAPGRRRRSWTLDEKRRIIDLSLEDGASIAEVARRLDLNANQLTAVDLNVLHAKIGELTLADDLESAQQSRPAERKAMIDRSHAFLIKGQARMLGLSRSTVHSKPRPVSAEALKLMRRVDELHLVYPFRRADAARSVAARGRRRRPPACGDADEANGDRSALSATEYEQAFAGTHDYPFSRAA